MTYTINELRLMNNEMLREISLQRYKKSRRSTGDALRAQKFLWERAGQPFSSSANYKRNHTATGVKF